MLSTYRSARTTPKSRTRSPAPRRSRAVLSLSVFVVGFVLAVLFVPEPGVVGAQAVTAEVAVDKTVYRGHDSGEGCPGEEEVLGVHEGEVTYCFVVTNSGDVALEPVVLEDAELGLTTPDMTVVSGDLSSMAPGETAVLYVETIIDGDLTNVVGVSGTAVDDAGEPLVGVDAVTATDTAEVVEVTAEVAVDKTVYRGHDSGEGCPGEEEVLGVHEGEVTYCFVVTNSGDVALEPVVLEDAELGLTTPDMTVVSGDLSSMAPGETAVLYVETIIDGDLTNVVGVSGTAVDDAGEPLVGVDAVTATDTAEVDEVTAELSLLTEVFDPYTGEYLDADDDEETAGSNDPMPATLVGDDGATFRFSVLNSGETDIHDVVVEAPRCDATPVVFDGDGGEIGVLEPEELWYLRCDVAEVAEAFTLGAAVTGELDGGDEPDGAGKMETARVQRAAVSVDITVQDPATGDFGNLAVVDRGSDVTFQIKVENTGDAPLADLRISDAKVPDCDRVAEEVLEPGDVLAAYECTADEVMGGFVNDVDVVAVPVDAAGEPVAEDVVAASSATVNTTTAAASALSMDKSLVAADQIGRTATWALTVTNTGAVDATEPIVVTDELPEGLEYLRSDGDGWTCGDDAGLVRCTTELDLGPGASTTVRLETDVLAAPGATVTNVARVEGGAEDDAALEVHADGDQAYITPPLADTLPRTGASNVLALVALGLLLIAGGSLLRSGS